MKPSVGFLLFIAIAIPVAGTATFTQGRGATAPPAPILLKPARVFDGDAIHEGWVVRLRGTVIEAAGPPTTVSAQDAVVIDLPGTTLLPGLIEAHSHVLLHPYNETSWNDQVT